MVGLIKNDYTTPKFIICDTPIKDGSFHDDRVWIYCPSALTLIEFIALDGLKDFQFKDDDYFVYTNIEGDQEHWTAQFTQNNCEMLEIDENQLKLEAIEIFKKHLTQLDNEIL